MDAIAKTLGWAVSSTTSHLPGTVADQVTAAVWPGLLDIEPTPDRILTIDARTVHAAAQDPTSPHNRPCQRRCSGIVSRGGVGLRVAKFLASLRHGETETELELEPSALELADGGGRGRVNAMFRSP